MTLALVLGTAVSMGTPAPMMPDADLARPAPLAEVGRTELIRFHSDAWINLHHFLYQWARDEAGVASGRQHVPVPERDELGSLTPEQRGVWDTAVAFYVEHLAPRGHFDDPMWAIKAGLLEIAERPGAGPSQVIPADVVPGVAGHLEAAMEVYAERWWPDHDRSNREWIAQVLPLAQAHEARFVAVMERSYGGSWGESYRLDASAYANWAGGYTSNGPPHTVVWSTDPDVAGLKGLEMVYHEAGHIRSLSRPNRNGLRAAFEAVGDRPPQNLSHAIIFYTAGWTTRGIAQDLGLPEHVPYAVDQGLIQFGGWQGLWPALEAEWSGVLEGAVDREDGLRALAEHFAG